MADQSVVTKPATTKSVEKKDREKNGSGYVKALQRYGALLILLVICVVFSILSPDSFATEDNFKNILQQQAVLACLALGLLLPIAVGEFDLSVGFVLGFGAVLAAKLGGEEGMGAATVIPIVLAAGLLIGTLNGVLTAKFGINSLIATLGVGFAVSGGSIGVSGGKTLFEGIPQGIKDMAQTDVFGIQSAVWIVFVLALLMYVMLSFTPFGRRIYAVGGSERVAQLAGVRTHAVKIAAFALAGGFAAFAGLLQLGQSGAATAAFGQDLLLPAFAAIFLGATAIRPGTFNVWGTIIAILLLAAGFTGLGLQGVPLWVQPIFNGAVLLIAVFLTRGASRGIGKSA